MKTVGKKRPPKIFQPLLWSFKWQDIDVMEDKDVIIVNTVNEGTLSHWHWLIQTYGKQTIQQVLERHLASEFHPESRNLAKIIFSISKFRYAR
jgi:hypothetical protein